MTLATDWRGLVRSSVFWIMGALALVLLAGVSPAHASDATAASTVLRNLRLLMVAPRAAMGRWPPSKAGML